MQKRNVLNSPRLAELKKQRRKSFWLKVCLYGFSFLAVMGLILYVSRIRSLNIYSIEVTGNKVVDTHMIQTVVQGDLAGKYLLLIPKTNVLLYPKGKTLRDLRAAFPRLENITLSVVNKNTLQVAVTERQAVYTWCGASLEAKPPSESLASQEQCYFLDDSGYVFDQAPYFSGEVYFKFYGGGDAAIGSYFSQNNFSQLVALKASLESIGLTPVSLYETADGDIQIYLTSSSKASFGPEIIFKTDADFQNQAENLQAALSTEPLQTEFKTKYSNLLYIDLRYGDKVYYKFSVPGIISAPTPAAPVNGSQ